MKKIFLLVLLPVYSFSQKTEVIFPIDSVTKLINYTEVVKVDSLSAQQLYSNAKLFVANAFVNGKHVMQLEDEPTKTIVAKGTIKMSGNSFFNKVTGYVNFKFTIQCKDGKYKYSITEFEHVAAPRSSNNGGPLESKKPFCGLILMDAAQWRGVKKETNDNITSLIIDMRKYMANKALALSKDW